MESSTTPIRIVIGAGTYTNNPDWLQTQQSELDLLRREDWAAQFQPNSISAILAEHVWEHLDFEEGVQAARICSDYPNSSYSAMRCIGFKRKKAKPDSASLPTLVLINY